MSSYIDGFVFPIAEAQLEAYKEVADQVARIWVEHGATSYREFYGDDLRLEGTRSFTDVAEVKEGEVVIFGLTIFPSKAARDGAFQKVLDDPRMRALEKPLMQGDSPIFDPSRMVFGGFRELINSEHSQTD
ncbi:DUF1428 domain-containing protein [Cryomorphaceae bacterium]|nr:DUF1428 domain-containing protein [Cryomorphaceae bacterium]